MFFPDIDYVFFGAILVLLCSAAAHFFHFEKTRFILFFFGFVLLTLFMIYRSTFLGIFISFNFLETNFFLPWCISLLALVGSLSSRDHSLWESLIFPVCLLLLFAVPLPRGVLPPSVKGETIFVSLFFFSEILALTCFISGGWLAMMNLFKRNESFQFHSFIFWGFLLYSIAQVTGACWSYLGWSIPFHWNGRHLQSAAIWCFYGALAHWKFMPRGSRKQEAALAIAGAVIIIVFSLLGQINESGMPRLEVH
jgi:hypothetical protein